MSHGRVQSLYCVWRVVNVVFSVPQMDSVIMRFPVVQISRFVELVQMFPVWFMNRILLDVHEFWVTLGKDTRYYHGVVVQTKPIEIAVLFVPESQECRVRDGHHEAVAQPVWQLLSQRRLVAVQRVQRSHYDDVEVVIDAAVLHHGLQADDVGLVFVVDDLPVKNFRRRVALHHHQRRHRLVDLLPYEPPPGSGRLCVVPEEDPTWPHEAEGRHDADDVVKAEHWPISSVPREVDDTRHGCGTYCRRRVCKTVTTLSLQSILPNCMIKQRTDVRAYVLARVCVWSCAYVGKA